MLETSFCIQSSTFHTKTGKTTFFHQTSSAARSGVNAEPLCRLYHGRVPRRQGASYELPIFYHAVSTFWIVEQTFGVGLDVTTTKKKVVSFFGEEKCTPEKVLAPCMAPALSRYGPPEWLIPPCVNIIVHNICVRRYFSCLLPCCVVPFTHTCKHHLKCCSMW